MHVTGSETFAERLRRLREAAGLTQEELAQRAGLSSKAVSLLERGERTRPYPHTVTALADALGLSDEDRSMLDRHAAVRSERGWGGGLEQTFYTPLDLEAALKLGVEKKHLDEYQAKIEGEVLAHFAPRVDKLLRAERPRLNAFAKRLKEYAPRLKDFATQASRLFGDAKHTLPIHLIANPADHDMGGGYNGERLTLEIPRKSDAFPTLLHEVFHAFLFPRMKDLEKAAEGVKGLDAQTLNEGLAYAISPGLFHNSGPKSDPLALRVREYRAGGAGLEDSYARFHMFGLALRPLVKDALEKEGETFERLLPRAIDAWRVLAELAKADSAKRDYRADPTPSAFIFGPAWQAAQERTKPLNRHCFTRNHLAAHYDEMFKANDKPGDLVILLLSLSSPERVPDAYRDVLRENDLSFDPAHFRKCDYYFEEDGYLKMMDIIHSGKPMPRALLCFNDDIAIGALKALRESWIKCPEDLAIIGYDGIERGKYVLPPLTTIRQPLERTP